jgi:hypothetical protein
MAAKDSLNNHLFDSMFQRMHGMTLQQASEGYEGFGGVIANHLKKDLVSPEEQDEVWNEWKRTNQLGVIKPPEGPVREVAASFFKEPVDVGAVAQKWMINHETFLVGGRQAVARDAIALSNALRDEGQTPTSRIYRGAVVSPQDQAQREPDLPISFTEDRHVATSFARPSNRGSGGRIFKVDPTTERGLFIPDLVDRERTVGQGHRPEREWLIDPDTINGR